MLPKDAVYRTCRISGELRIDLGRGCSDFPGATVAHCQQRATTSGSDPSSKVVLTSYAAFNVQNFPRSARTVYLIHVLCGSQSKQRLLPYTALTGWINESFQLDLPGL